MTTSWQPTTLVQCISVRPWLTFPGCDEPGGCHDLTLGRIYELLGVEASGSFYRIVDDSGDDYPDPASPVRDVARGRRQPRRTRRLTVQRHQFAFRSPAGARQAGDAWRDVEPPRTCSAGIHDEPAACARHELPMRVAVHDDVGVVPFDQRLRPRRSDLVAVIHMDRNDGDVVSNRG